MTGVTDVFSNPNPDYDTASYDSYDCDTTSDRQPSIEERLVQLEVKFEAEKQKNIRLSRAVHHIMQKAADCEYSRYCPWCWKFGMYPKFDQECECEHPEGCHHTIMKLRNGPVGCEECK